MPRSMLFRLVASSLALIIVASASACGGDDDPAADDTSTATSSSTATDDGSTDDGSFTDTTSATEEAPTPEPLDGTCAEGVVDLAADIEDLETKPSVELPATAPTELVIDDVVTGAGDEVAAGDFVLMQYVGVACSTGEEFDSSWDRGQLFSVLLGEGRVIDGWDEGIVGMAVGGRRVLTIPPDKAYGDEGSGSGSILPGETLIFVVDLVHAIPADASLPEPTVPAEPATELVTNDLTEGDGAEAVEGATVWIHFRGFAQSTGEQFDASLDRGVDQPVVSALVEGQLIPGLLEGITGMKVGGVREIVVPADLGFGDTGAGDGAIGPDETLVFVVGLYAVT